MKFKYGDNVRIKTGFFAGLEGKVINGNASHHCEFNSQGDVTKTQYGWGYSVDSNSCATTPFEKEDNLEALDYTV